MSNVYTKFGPVRHAGLLNRLLLAFVAASVLASCAPRLVAGRAAPVPSATVEQIFVATHRRLDRTGPVFGATRSTNLKYFKADVSIPPNHTPGNVEWTDGPPDAETDFVVTNTQVYGGSGAMLSDMRKRIPGNETLVFVHGYNNTLSDAMFRFAQIQTDFKTRMPGVLFSWPSAGDPRGYAYDRDSVLFSRDDFESVLKDLTARSGQEVFLLAHSMGSQLVMETLRQAALRGDRKLLSRISGVVLMSPDIDPEIFRRQAEAIGNLPDPFLIFVSQDDHVLSLASLITGRKPRLGKIDSAAQLKGLDVKVLDFTQLGNEEGLNHAVATSSPTAISVLRGMMDQARAGGAAFEDYTVLRPKR